MTAADQAMAELVDAIGADAARQLAQRFGGTSVYVPRAVGEHHPLRVALGVDAVVKLVEWYGGGRLSIPKQPERRARVRALRNAGALTIAGIAVETGFSERHVYRLLSEPDDRQSDLFDPN